MSNPALSPIRRALRAVVCCSAILGSMSGCHASGSNGPAAGPTPGDRVEIAEDESAGGRYPATSRSQQQVRIDGATRVEELLVGRVPGVEVRRTPSGGVSIHIRGRSTLSGSGEPLFIVDGVEVFVAPGRGLDWLNPADVAHIDVLKDATSTTMYGVRGANGVVLITTRRAR